jgi:hypothetical protein
MVQQGLRQASASISSRSRGLVAAAPRLHQPWSYQQRHWGTPNRSPLCNSKGLASPAARQECQQHYRCDSIVVRAGELSTWCIRGRFGVQSVLCTVCPARSLTPFCARRPRAHVRGIPMGRIRVSQVSIGRLPAFDCDDSLAKVAVAGCWC